MAPPCSRPATPTLSTRLIGGLERTQIIFGQWFRARIAQSLRAREGRATMPVVRQPGMRIGVQSRRSPSQLDATLRPSPVGWRVAHLRRACHTAQGQWTIKLDAPLEVLHVPSFACSVIDLADSHFQGMGRVALGPRAFALRSGSHRCLHRLPREGQGPRRRVGRNHARRGDRLCQGLWSAVARSAAAGRAGNVLCCRVGDQAIHVCVCAAARRGWEARGNRSREQVFPASDARGRYHAA